MTEPKSVHELNQKVHQIYDKHNASNFPLGAAISEMYATLDSAGLEHFARKGLKETFLATKRKFKPTGTSAAQREFLGAGFDFKHLKTHYPRTENSETVMVPLMEMTVTDLRNRANQYLAMATGNQAHVRELLLIADMKEQGID